MPQTRSSVTVDPSKIGTASVRVTTPAGTDVPAYTTANGSTAVTWPDEITTPTTFHLTTDGDFLVSVKVNDVEVANGNGGVLRGGSGHMTVAPSLNTIAELAAGIVTQAPLTGAFAPKGVPARAGASLRGSGIEAKGSNDVSTSGDAFAWFHKDDPLGAGIPVGYINDGGHIYQQRALCVSGTTNATGTRRIIEPFNGFYTIAMWTDGSTGDPELVARANNDNQPLIQIRERLGNRRFNIDELGKLHWAPNGTNNNASTPGEASLDAAIDLSLSRAQARTLLVQGEDGGSDTTLRINAPVGTPLLHLQRNGSTIVEIAAQATTSQYKTLGLTTFSTYTSGSTPRLAVGGDRSTSVLSVLASTSSYPVLTVKGHASQSLDLVQVMSSAEAIYGRFDKNGHFMTRKVAAPADSDLVAGELAYWFDASNGAAKAMFKGKSADGTVVSGSVALA